MYDLDMKLAVATLTLAAMSAAAQTTPARLLCLDTIRTTLKDPASARIELVTKDSIVDVTGLDGKVQPAQKYSLLVNAKNSFGAYTGAKPYRCLLTVDERRVIDVTGF
jgi:hypothetical protein